MAVTEIEKISWGSRIGDSLKGTVRGMIMFLAAFPLLFWNEGSAVKTARALDEWQGAVVEVESNKKVYEDNDGMLVYMTGKAETKEILRDAVFGVSENCIRLERKVEIYQWTENVKTTEKKNVGGSVTKTKTYTYELGWCDEPVKSVGFKEPGHDNPLGDMEFKSETWQAENVTFGAFTLSERQIDMMKDDRAYSIPSSFTSKVDRVQVAGDIIYVPEKTTRVNKLNNRDIQSQTRPGDMRVTYRIVKPHNVSIVAKQRGESFVSYTAKNGKGINMLHDGIADSAEMFETARRGNAIITWLLRFIGFFLMWAGLKAILGPISTLGDVLPFLGDLLGAGIGLVAGVLALVLSIAVIAVAWVFYRPVLGIILLLLAGAGVFFLWKKRSAAGNATSAK